MRNKNIVFILIGILLIASCRKKTTKEKPSDPVVYAAGVMNNNTGTGTIATLWIDGKPQSLTDGSNNSYAKAIKVIVSENNDIHIAGVDGPGNKQTAKYWKNGVVTSLSDGSYRANATGMCVAGNDVYISGYESQDNGNVVAQYWKNGDLITLSSPSNSTETSGIGISGNNVIVCGTELDTKNIAKLWVNGVAINLSPAGVDSRAYDLAIEDSIVYIAGAESQNVLYYRYNLNSKKLSKIILANTGYGGAFAIAVKNGNVYATGWLGWQGYDNAVYWKNTGNNYTNLENTGMDSHGYGIFLLGNEIYVSGNDTEKCRLWKSDKDIPKFPYVYRGTLFSVFVK